MADYRIFVGAFPTGDFADQIQSLRQQHDPKTAFITPPHVTLWGTMWRSGPATPENEAETIAKLEAIAAQIQPFDLQLGGIESFPPNHRVIYLAVGKNEGLLASRRQLLSVLGQDKHRSFTPHLTLTMRLNAESSGALYHELCQSKWHTNQRSVPITHLQLMQRGANDPAWRVIYRLRLRQ